MWGEGDCGETDTSLTRLRQEKVHLKTGVGRGRGNTAAAVQITGD
jgi:hypothetical protein